MYTQSLVRFDVLRKYLFQLESFFLNIWHLTVLSSPILHLFLLSGDNPVTTEPTFEDVMTLWVAVLMWSVQTVVTDQSYAQTASRITGKVYALIKQHGAGE